VTGDCKGEKTQNGAHDCKSCPAYNCFYQVATGYASEEGITWSEAIWLAKQFYDIPTVYMCNGKDGEWMKEHTPAQYNECLKRQAELMDEPLEDKMLEERTPEKSAEVLTGQMTIDEYLKGVSDG
jgi:hypothetical protein